MNTAAATWLVIALALLAANAPFFSRRLLFVKPMASGKHFGWHLLELVLLYFVVGGIALTLEGRAGRVADQNWEFYAVTAALFATLAFPGFVWRFLMHRGA